MPERLGATGRQVTLRSHAPMAQLDSAAPS